MTHLTEIKSIGQIDEIIGQYFVKGTATNNYLIDEKLKLLVSKGKLFAFAKGSNAFLLEKREGFFQFYYYLNDFTMNLELDLQQPLVMEILYRNLDNKPAQIIEFWKNNGFSEHLTRINMVATINEPCIESAAANVEVSFAKTGIEVDYAKELLDSTGDRYTGDRLSAEELHRFMINQNLLIVYYNRMPAGVLQFELRNNTTWLGHLAVDPAFRGKGLADVLWKASINLNLNKTNKFALWVVLNNDPAINLYKKYGFFHNNKTTTSLLLT